MVTQTPYERNRVIRNVLSNIASRVMFNKLESFDNVEIWLRQKEIEVESEMHPELRRLKSRHQKIEDVSITKSDSLVYIKVVVEGQEYETHFDERLLLV